MDRKLVAQGLLLITLNSPLAFADALVNATDAPDTPTATAPADPAAPMRDEVNDLSVQKESDQLDVYDEKEIERQTKKETAELQRESVHLQNDIDRLARESKALAENIKKKTSNYAEARKNYKRMVIDVAQMKSQRNHLKTQVERLTTKVHDLNEKLAQVRTERVRLAHEVREHERTKARLTARKKQADNSLQKNKQEIAKLRKQARS